MAIFCSAAQRKVVGGGVLHRQARLEQELCCHISQNMVFKT